jgi:hypothetical protein
LAVVAVQVSPLPSHAGRNAISPWDGLSPSKPITSPRPTAVTETPDVGNATTRTVLRSASNRPETGPAGSSLSLIGYLAIYSDGFREQLNPSYELPT